MINSSAQFSPNNLVTWISANSIYLENISPDIESAIQKIGAYEETDSTPTDWKIDFKNKKDLAVKLAELNKLGFLFVEGPGWHPAGVFDYLRKKKLIKGTFKRVAWRGTGDWYVVER